VFQTTAQWWYAAFPPLWKGIPWCPDNITVLRLKL
jgi:hypothetical protein